MLLVILIKVSRLTSLMRLHGGFKGGLMKPPAGLMKFHVGFLGEPHEASWGSHEAAWGVHENLTGVSWGPQGLMKLHGGFMGTL